jgi:hypothetical protein
MINVSSRRIHPNIWLLLVTVGLAVALLGASLYTRHVADGREAGRITV